MKLSFHEAVEILLDNVKPCQTETVGIDCLKGRVLAQDIIAPEDVPFYDRSPYDGYAFKAADTVGVDENRHIKLKVIDNIRAGQTSPKRVSEGTAIRLMTGASLPDGADAICKYEDTDYTESSVILKKEYRSGDNVIKAGEDIKADSLLAGCGSLIDTGLIGTLASLGIDKALVYKRPVAGIISTGDEVVEIDAPVNVGKIRNSNRYIMASALKDMGIDSIYLGHADDDIGNVKELILKGLEECDIILSTGGVSVGDYDIVPDAMKEAGFDIICRGVKMKPGMACAYGVLKGVLMLALSGNPASSLTNLQCVCMPALKKLCGISEYRHTLIKMKLKNDFDKENRGMRFLRGRLNIESTGPVLDAPDRQGNVVISSAIGCNAYGILTPGSGPYRLGDEVEGFMV